MTVPVCCAGTGQPAKTKVRRKERSKAKLLPQVECHFGRDIPDLSTPLLRHIANGDKVRMVRVGHVLQSDHCVAAECLLSASCFVGHTYCSYDWMVM
jgi:hypothetical protein